MPKKITILVFIVLMLAAPSFATSPAPTSPKSKSAPAPSKSKSKTAPAPSNPTPFLLLPLSPPNVVPAISKAQFQSVLDSADNGDAHAQYKLGLYYDAGNGVKKNAKESINWYKKAAKNGHPLAQTKLGVIYENGEGLHPDINEAVKWYEKAANQGYALAQYNLGLYYEDQLNKYKKRDYPKAYDLFLKAANSGVTNAYYHTAVNSYKGRGTPVNNVEAYKWLLLAKSAGIDISVIQDTILKRLSPAEIEEATNLAKNFKPKTLTN